MGCFSTFDAFKSHTQKKSCNFMEFAIDLFGIQTKKIRIFKLYPVLGVIAHPRLNLTFSVWCVNKRKAITKTRRSELFFRVYQIDVCMAVHVHVRAYLFVRSSLILRSTFIRRSLNRCRFFFIFTDWMRLITTSIQICDYKFHTLSLPYS